METFKEPLPPARNFKQHRGRFKIPESWIARREEPMYEMDYMRTLSIFKGMIIIKCEYHFCEQCFEYEAIGPMFSLVKEFDTSPMYSVRIKNDGTCLFDSGG